MEDFNPNEVVSGSLNYLKYVLDSNPNLPVVAQASIDTSNDVLNSDIDLPRNYHLCYTTI
jgi:hypothetical protein